MALAAATVIGASSIKTLGNVASTGINQSTALSGQRNMLTMQNNNYDFIREQQKLREDKFKEAGLPGYLAYTGGANLMPKQSQMAGGNMIYTSRLPGNPKSVPYTGAPLQGQLGWGSIS